MDEESPRRWEASEERRRSVEEVRQYATQQYSPASGLETWFKLLNVRAVAPPPKWKMARIALLGVSLASFLARVAFGGFVQSIPVVLASLLSSTILVICRTWLLMPAFARIFRRWLYPSVGPAGG